MKLIRSTAIIGFFTLMSRILGLVRDRLTAHYLGAGPINDALITAMKLPNLFRRMFAEGAFNAAFIPLYVRHKEEGGEAEAAAFASEAMASLIFIVALIVLGFQITMPWSLYLMGPGLVGMETDVEKTAYELAVLYARITMPYLLLMSVTAMLGGALNAHGRFAAAAGAPILLNIILISVLYLAGDDPVVTAEQLSYGVTLSGLAQAALLFWAARRSGGVYPPPLCPCMFVRSVE